MRILGVPLPGDLVIRQREDHTGVRTNLVFVITRWPDADTVLGGPYQSFGYALRQARGNVRDGEHQIWRDHAHQDQTEALVLTVE